MSYHVTNAQGGTALPQESQGPDYEVTFDGSSLWLVRPTNAAANQHLEENVSDEAQWWAGALVVEHRYIGGVIDGLTDNGFNVRVN